MMASVSGPTRGARYSRARYYHPALQRFISEDPIGFAGGDTNLYAYVWNSPMGLVDPLGLDAWSDAGNLAAGFGDTLTMGGTAWVRGLWIQQFGLPDTVDASSTWNLAGRKTAYAWDAAMAILSGAAAVRAAPSVLPLLTNEIGGIITRTSVVEGSSSRSMRFGRAGVAEALQKNCWQA
jgi:RHS repeat-associated protein